MARTCKQCGEKLFPTDTFCGFCGATVEDASGAMESFSYAPRSLVGNNALSKNEREEIERAKRKYINETAVAMEEEVQIAKLKAKEQAIKLEAEKKAAEEAAKAEEEKKEQFRISIEQLRLKKEELLAAKAASEKAVAEETVRLEAEKKAVEEAVRLEAERKAAEEAARLEKEKREAEETEKIKENDENTEEVVEEEESPEETYSPVKVTSTSKKEEDAEVWLSAEKRARAEQREADKIKRKNSINERKNTLTRDIILLSIGIILLVIVLVFLIKSELDELTGNDKNHNKTPVATQESSISEPEFPLDMGKAWDGTVATKFYKGDGSAENPYLISAGSELAYLAYEVNRGVNFSDVYFSVSEDIDLGGLDWTPIGYYFLSNSGEDLVYSFNGNFDGNNHVISNYKISSLSAAMMLPNYSNNRVCGLFGTTNGATLSNIVVKDCVIEPTFVVEGEVLAGALVGCAYDTEISTCNITAKINIDCVETATYRVAAGTVAGATSNGSIKNMTVSGDVSVDSGMGVNDVAIVMGYSKGTEIADLNVSGTVFAKADANVYCGGVSGYASEITVSNASVDAVISSEVTDGESKLMAGMLSGYQSGCAETGSNLKGTLTVNGVGTVYAGGACGYAEKSEVGQIVTEVIVEATSTGSGVMLMAGGVYGMSTETVLDGTKVSGSIASVSAEVNYVGGIVGLATGGSISNIECSSIVNGQVTATEAAQVMAGGAAGNITDVTLEELKLSGSVTVNSTVDGYLGGASGYISGGSYVNVVASGALSNSSTTGVCTGGFAGYAKGSYTSEGCSGSNDRTNSGKNVYDEDFVAIVEE